MRRAGKQEDMKVCVGMSLKAWQERGWYKEVELMKKRDCESVGNFGWAFRESQCQCITLPHKWKVEDRVRCVDEEAG